MTLVSSSIKFMRIFAGVSWTGGVERQWSCLQRQFSVLSLAIFSESLETRPELLYRDTKSLIGFPLIPESERVTLNDPEWLFHVKFCFRACRSRTHLRGFRKQYWVKINTGRPTLSAANMQLTDPSFW